MPSKYEDFYAWSLATARELHAERPELAEFMESVGKSQLRELRSRLRVLVMHMLKCQHQPEKHTISWDLTIDEQRDEILSIIEESPSLKRKLELLLPEVYAVSRKRAALETGMAEASFSKGLSLHSRRHTEMTVDANKQFEKLADGPLTFGRVLKSNRTSEGWSQQDLADRIRVSKMTISLFERGKSLPTPENLKAIARVFRMPVESFLRYVLQDYAAKHGDFDVEIKHRAG